MGQNALLVTNIYLFLFTIHKYIHFGLGDIFENNIKRKAFVQTITFFFAHKKKVKHIKHITSSKTTQVEVEKSATNNKFFNDQR